MTLETVLLAAGLVLYLGSLAYGYYAAQKLERASRTDRIAIVTATRYLEAPFLLCSLLWFAMFVDTLFTPRHSDPRWLQPVVFLVLAVQTGFPRGLLVRPGLATQGLVYQGTLYRWSYFSGYQVRGAGRIRLLYQAPQLGFKGLTVRLRPHDESAFLSRLHANNLEPRPHSTTPAPT